LFCDNKARSQEHVWPEWALAKLPTFKITGSLGRHKHIQFDREWTVGSVCESCNGGWMSDLESDTSPVMGPLIDDRSTYLGIAHQRLIAVWAAKTAMVADSTTVAPNRPLFFRESERLSMRLSRTIPDRTLVWIGRYLNVGLGADSGTCYYGLPEVFERYTGFLTTLVMGALAIQIFVLRAPANYRYSTIEFSPAKGPWSEVLCPIWPAKSSVYWPPILAFDDNVLAIGKLHGRWRLGSEYKVF
jgi:hypothetical protein